MNTPSRSRVFSEQKRYYKRDFENGKADVFARIGLGSLSIMRSLLRPRKNESKEDQRKKLMGPKGTVEDWRRAVRHSMVVAARAQACAALLVFPAEIQQRLGKGGIGHDFHKKREMKMVEVARSEDQSEWDANCAAREEAQAIMQAANIDPHVIELMNTMGNLGIRTADELLRQETLNDNQLAQLVLAYSDWMTRETYWSRPACEIVVDGTRQRKNALDLRVDALEMNSAYSGFNHEAQEHGLFENNETAFQALRRVGHAIEARLTTEILNRTGQTIDPLDLPMAIDDCIRARIEGNDKTTRQSTQARDAAKQQPERQVTETADDVLDPEKLGQLEQELYHIGDMVLQMSEAGLSRTAKEGNPDTNFVTNADLASERGLCAAIERLWPDHGIVGEEETTRRQNAEYVWRIDPVDGTFRLGHGHSFGISAGLIKDGEPCVGMILFPDEGKMLKAERGRGATINGKPLCVHGTQTLSEATVGFDHSSSGQHEDQFKRLRTPLDVAARSTHNLWSATKGLLDILEGNAHAYVCSGATPEDIAAALVIARETGCVYAPFDGCTAINLKDPPQHTPIIFANSQALLVEILALYSHKT